MGVEKTVKITPMNTASLKDILGEEGKEEFEYIKEYVETYVTSKFRERRIMALWKLKKYFNPNLSIHTVVEGDAMAVYISPVKDKDAFLFIEKYLNEPPSNSHEPTLTEGERIIGRELNYN